MKSFFFVCLVFLLSGFSFTNITNHSTAGERGGHFFNSSPLLPPASQTQTLARRLLQRAHLCTQVAAGLEPKTSCFSFFVKYQYCILVYRARRYIAKSRFLDEKLAKFFSFICNFIFNKLLLTSLWCLIGSLEHIFQNFEFSAPIVISLS